MQFQVERFFFLVDGGWAIFDEVFCYCSSNAGCKKLDSRNLSNLLFQKYLVLQINCASLWSFFDTALQDIAVYKSKSILKAINISNKLNSEKKENLKLLIRSKIYRNAVPVHSQELC